MQENPILAWRRREGLSRQELALRSGLGVSTLAAIELGYTKSLAAETVGKLRAVGYPGNPQADYRMWRRAVEERAAAQA